MPCTRALRSDEQKEAAIDRLGTRSSVSNPDFHSAIIRRIAPLIKPLPKSIQELKQNLKKAWFTLLPKRGKGSHTYWIHPLLINPVILSGKDRKDAQPYHEKDVLEALQELKKIIQENDR